MLQGPLLLLSSVLLAPGLSSGGERNAATSEPPAEQSGVEVPRVEGPYIGVSIPMYAGWTHVRESQLEYEYLEDPPSKDRYTLGGGFVLRYGQTLTRRFGLGFTLGFMRGTDLTESTRMGHGEVSMEFFLKPVLRRKWQQWTVHASLGGGFGRSRLDTEYPELILAGTLLSVFTRYAFFPGIDRRRPHRAGGFCLGPEIGVAAFLPGAWTKNSHAEILLGLWVGHFFGY